MLTTQLPGFIDITRDSQKTFRTLLEALSERGLAREMTVAIAPPEGMTKPCAAACLTLLDLETVVWLSARVLRRRTELAAVSYGLSVYFCAW